MSYGGLMRASQPYLGPATSHFSPVLSFINKELVLFSVADNQRSIPSIMDGFKPSQRKVSHRPNPPFCWIR